MAPRGEQTNLKKLGELDVGKVPDFQSMKPLRSWVTKETKEVMKINVVTLQFID